MILFLDSNGKITGWNTFLSRKEAEKEVKRCAWMGAYFFDGEHDFDADKKEGHNATRYFDKKTKIIRVEYAPIEPEPEEPLSGTEQAILQTALTTEYIATLQEMTLGF